MRGNIIVLSLGVLLPLLVVGAAAPAVSGKPQAATVLVRDGDLWVGKNRVTAGAADDGDPDWSPDRRRIAFTRAVAGSRTSELWIVRWDGGGLRQVTRGFVDVQPAWSPDGERIAFARSPLEGGSFDIAVVGARGGKPRVRVDRGLELISPSWTDSGALAFDVLTPGETWPEKTRDDGSPAFGPKELLPDFDQRAPRGLVVSLIGRRWTLGFDSAVDNVGEGPLHVRSHRSLGERSMLTDQIVHMDDGSRRVYADVGLTRFVIETPHRHWHLLDFDRYELRAAEDFSLVVRDRKSGFCLTDRYGHAARRVAGFSGPHFLGTCGKGRPDLLSIEQGTSIGFTDRYRANFHGQNVDLTGVAAGEYILVHRANPDGLLEELDYANNAASLRVRLTWNGRKPTVKTLRSCDASERC